MQWCKLLIFGTFAWCCALSLAETKINHEKFFTAPNITEFTLDLFDLIRRLRMEENFYGFYFYRNRLTDCVDEQLPTHFSLPALQYNKYAPVYVRGTGNSMILTIVCLTKLTSRNYLLKLASDLQHIRSGRVLVIFNRNMAYSTQRDLTTFFHFFMELNFLNVALIHRDFNSTNIYHTYHQFPEFELEMRVIHETDKIFPNRLRDANGKKLWSLADQIEPHTMVYADENGEVNIAGYIGQFILTFTKKYNLTLSVPDNYNASKVHVVNAAEIRAAALSGTIDVGVSLLTPQKEGNLRRYTYPIEHYQLLTMLPLEPALETYKFFITFFRPSVLSLLFILIWYICFMSALQMELGYRTRFSKRTLILLLIAPWNMNMLRPLFCQSTRIRGRYFSRRMIYILAFALGGILNNFFATNLAKWLTVPPHEKPIESFDEVAERQLQIQVAAAEISDIKLYRGEEFWLRYKHVFKVMPTLDEYQDNIRNMDDSYGYVITTIAWPIIERRQNYFAKALFRLSESLYFTKGALLSLPVNENSIYRDILNHFGIRARETGLLHHWYEDTFFRMVKLKRINLKDLSTSYRHELLTLKEFKWIWTAYCIGMALSMLVLFVEIAYWRNMGQRVKAYFRSLFD